MFPLESKIFNLTIHTNKNMNFERLMQSLTVQRFEHSNRFHKKISTPVQFPEELNMGPFTTEYRNAEVKNGNKGPVTLVPNG